MTELDSTIGKVWSIAANHGLETISVQFRLQEDERAVSFYTLQLPGAVASKLVVGQSVELVVRAL